jgi:hypothetical protein
MAFVKVVEGSEIYNFPTDHTVHFSSKCWSYARPNRGTMKLFQPVDAEGTRTGQPGAAPWHDLPATAAPESVPARAAGCRRL